MSMPDDDQPGGRASALEAEPDRFRQLIAITLSGLIVLGAGLAILQVQASSNESNTARETTRTAVEAMSANVTAATVAGLAPQLSAERAFMAFRRPLTPGAPSLAEAAGIKTPKAQTAGRLHVAQQAVPDPGAATLLPALQTEAERLTLGQHALATTRITWNDRSTQYTTVIAVLAVAIFLIGFGLVVGGPIRRSAYALGVTVGLFAAAWAVWIYLLPIPVTPKSAIQATARGSVLTENGQYHAALAHYDMAIRAAPGYATAYSGRARARLLQANPDYPVTRAATDLSGQSFAKALIDAQKAHQLDSRDILATTLLALTSFYHGDYNQALTATNTSITINPKVPDLWLLKSAIDVAMGDQPAANAALSHAIALLHGAAPSQQTRLLASTYLSYMAWIERHDPGHAHAAQTQTQRVVSVETAHTLSRVLTNHAPENGTASVTRLRFASGKLTLQLRWARLPPKTALTAIGYERPLPRGAWAQPSNLALFATVTGSGTRRISLPLTRACQPTSVRIDLYLNGVPTTSTTGPGAHPTC